MKSAPFVKNFLRPWKDSFNSHYFIFRIKWFIFEVNAEKSRLIDARTGSKFLATHFRKKTQHTGIVFGQNNLSYYNHYVDVYTTSRYLYFQIIAN